MNNDIFEDVGDDKLPAEEQEEIDYLADKAHEIGAEDLREEFIRLKRKETKHSIIFGFAMLILFALVIVTLVFTIIRIQYTKTIQNQLNAMSTIEKDSDVTFDGVMDKLKNLQNFLSTYFLFDESLENVGDKLYHALFEALGDPYSIYYNEEEYKELSQSSSATYEGIGVTVSKDAETGYVRIQGVSEEGGAYEAGLLEGDMITAVNGVTVVDRELTEITFDMKGEKGTTVKVSIYRPSEDRSFDVELERRNINLTTAAGIMLDDNIGLIQISQFGSATADQFKACFDELKKEGMKAVVIDVRDNPGGQVSVVNNILDFLLPEGIIVYTQDKYGNRTDYSSDSSCEKLPMTVLINEKSASASEIFAGALQDYDWATIVGVTSFGKGIVQTIHALGDGTAVKVTVARYYTPNGTCIHGIGITPDVEIEYVKDDDIDNWRRDNQVVKAYEILLEEMK